MRKKIVLVGGCGFIGHNLALELSDNHDVVIIDSLTVNNLYSQDQDNFVNKTLYSSILNSRLDLIKEKKIEFILQDARDYHAMCKIFGNIKPDIIVHLAAVSHANKSNKDPHSTFDHSLRTLENTLDFAKDHNTHLIYMSSSMVYGDFKKEEVDEDEHCNPIGIYGNLKLAGELMIKSYNQVFGLPFTIIRPSALYGERCVSRRVGQIFIENALQDFNITINGNGDEKLDFTYIKDLVEGIKLCCENKKAINQIFNITFGNSRTIKELIEILKKEFPNIKVINKPRELLMPLRGTLSNKKSKEFLNYRPTYKLEEGYIEYIKWYKNFFSTVFEK